MSTRDYIINGIIVLAMLAVVFYVSFFSKRSQEVNAPTTVPKVEAPVVKCGTDCKKGA